MKSWPIAQFRRHADHLSFGELQACSFVHVTMVMQTYGPKRKLELECI
jgi:hypothetical protein